MKKKGLLALCIFTALGVITAVVGAIGLKFDFSSLGESPEKTTFTKNVDKDYSRGIENLNIDIIKGKTEINFTNDVSSIEISFIGTEQELVKNESASTLEISQGILINFNMWWNTFNQYSINTEMIINIPSSYSITNLNINMNMSEVIINNPHAQIQNYNISNGKLDILSPQGEELKINNQRGSVICSGEALFKNVSVKQKLGSVAFEKLHFNYLSFECSMGRLYVGVDDINNIKFNITVKCSSCNVTNEEKEALSTVEGLVKFGSVQFI